MKDFPKIIPVWLGLNKHKNLPTVISLSFTEIPVPDQYDLVIKTRAYRLDNVSMEDCKKMEGVLFIRRYKRNYLIEDMHYIIQEGWNFRTNEKYNITLYGKLEPITVKPYSIDFREE